MDLNKMFGQKQEIKHPSRNKKEDASKFGNKITTENNSPVKVLLDKDPRFDSGILWDRTIKMPLVYELDERIFPNYGRNFRDETKEIVKKYLVKPKPKNEE